MKLIVKCLVILSCSSASVTWAAWAEDIYASKYLDIRFSKASIAIITARDAYLFDRKVGLGRPHNGALTSDFLPSAARKKIESVRIEGEGENSYRDSELWDQWISTNGIVFQTQNGYCGESAEIYHRLLYGSSNIKINKKKCSSADSSSPRICLSNLEIETHLPGCESISDIAVVGDQVWLGSYEQHEGGDGEGSGARVISLKSNKLLASFSTKRKSMAGNVMALNYDSQTGKLVALKKSAAGRVDGGKLKSQLKNELADGFVRVIRHDPVSKDVWILTKSALHRVNNHKIIDRWYLSEQFNADGDVTLLATLKSQKSNPWAIMARDTKLAETRPIWRQLQQAPNLAKRITYAYDDDGKYFKVDGKRMSSYETVEDKQTTMLMWDFKTSQPGFAQELINRLSKK